MVSLSSQKSEKNVISIISPNTTKKKSEKPLKNVKMSAIWHL